MLLLITLFVSLGLVVILLAAQKESAVLKFLANKDFNYYLVYHVILSFYAAILGSYGKNLREKSFENLLYAAGKYYIPAAEQHRNKLFDKLKDQKKRVTILEVGIGTGGNFGYYPEECDLLVVEPNPEFRKDVENNLKNHKGIHLKQYYEIPGENMSPIEDNSVDIVLTTLVLCSVDAKRVISEIRRVLKPGGKYYFMDHTLDKPFTLRWVLQKIFGKSGVWPLVMLGCRFEDIPSNIKQAGFASVADNAATLKFVKFSPAFFLTSPHYYGIATN